MEYIGQDESKFDLKKVYKRYGGRKLISDFLSVVTAGSILGCTFGVAIDRVLNANNIFYHNELTLTESEIDQIYTTLDRELNVSLPEGNERVLLLNAIYENDHLTDEEKEVFYNSLSLIEDNPYFNKTDTYRNLLDVDVLYVERPSSCNEYVMASYSYFFNDINVYDSTYLSDTLPHECIHCLFVNSRTSDLPSAFCEGMTELLCKEYYSADPFCSVTYYPYEVAFVRLLCELIGSDAVLKSFTTGDMTNIYQSMAEIRGTEKDAKGLILSINDAMEEYSRIRSIDSEALEESLDELKEYVNQEFAFDSSVYYCCDYYDGIIRSLSDSKPIDTCINYLVTYGVCQKAYFSGRLKQDYSDYDFVDIFDREFVTVPKVKEKM